MKTKLTAATLAFIFAAAAAPSMAHERYQGGIRMNHGEYYDDGDLIRHDAPEFYYDRCGNPVVIHRERRAWIPVRDHYSRPRVVAPAYIPVPVYEPRCRTRSREPHFSGALRFIFGR